MENINKQLLDLLTYGKKEQEESLEERLGIKLCTSDYDHIYVMEQRTENANHYFGLKKIGFNSCRVAVLANDEVQRCIMCGKRQTISKIKGIK